MKHRWRTDMNWLCGLTLDQWLPLARAHGVAPAYLHRAALMSAMSAFNSAIATVGPAPAEAPVTAPLFVLGHWRSGTTFLYHLLAQDPRRAAPNAYQVVNPGSFPWTESWATRLFSGLIPDKRLQDDVPLGFAQPEEDEYAIGLLSGCSPYLGRSFPQQLAHYERFLTLADCTPAERAAFGNALTTFARRLSAHFGRPLILKSPAHTARVRTLLELFPDARFVHIHRHPYEVFQSTRHLYDTVDWLWALQRRTDDPDDTILRQYQSLHQAWFADRAALDPHQYIELPYTEVAADPLAAVRRIYAHLGLGDPEPARAPMQALLDRRSGHKTNHFAPLNADERARVDHVAGVCFDAWRYSPCAP